MMQARFACFPRPVVCSICNEQYKDVHEHIQHMTTVHQMKASFRCSTCGEIFPSKVAVEAHLKSHVTDNGQTVSSDTVMAINLSSNNGDSIINERSSSTSTKERDKPSSSGSSILSNIQVTRSACDAENVLALDIEEDEEEDGDDDLLKEVFSCSCGKAYFLRMSFDAHQKVCPVKMQQYSNTPTSTVTGNLESNYRNQSRPGDIARRSQGKGRSLGSLETLGNDLIGSDSSNCRKMVESIHSDGDTNCKACQKPMKGFISICNHLSRRNECREFYNDNFVSGHGLTEESSSIQDEKSKISMDKSNNSSGKLVDSLHTKRALTNTSSLGAPSTSSPVTVGGNSNNSSGSNSDSKMGQAPFTDLGPDDIIIAPADELIRRAYLVRNRVQCPRCTKIFGGKTPAVAYNNHRRNKHCPATQATVPYLKAKSNTKNKDQQSSPQLADILPSNLAPNNLVNPQESDLKLPDQSQVRYYCKLCPTRDTKNRVSLGVHLTTYHGLPPVNISSKDGVALRCQTCYQTFNSKYFYNMHRYECDLTSPYIGILDADKLNESGDLNTPNTSTSESKPGVSEEDGHLPAPPPSIMPPPIQSISPTPNSSQSHATHRHRQQSSPTLTQKLLNIRASVDSKTPPQSNPKVQPTFTGPPRGSAASNAYFTNNYTCTLCHKKGFPGPNAVRIHQKYQCVKRPLVPSPKSPYPSPLAKPRTKSYSRPLSRDESQSESNESRLALLLGNSGGHLNGKDVQNANRYGFPLCDDCGRGPYNSEYYLLEHKRLYCRGGASKSGNVTSQLDSSKFVEIENNNLESIPGPLSSKTKDSSHHIVPSSSSTTNNLIRPVPKKAKHSSDICLIIDNNRVTNGSYGKDKNGINNGSRSLLNNINNKHSSGHKPDPQDFDIDMTPENVPPGEKNNIIECTECGFRESDVFKFIRHRLAHFSDKPEDATNYACYSCEICKGKIVISQLSRIRQHFYHHVKIYNTLYKKEQKDRSSKKRPYPIEIESDGDDSMITCPYCRACRFEDASGLSQHIKTSCPFRFRCIKCDRTFLSKALLEDHKETCLDDVGLRSNNSKSLISCHHCGLKFTSKQRLFYHEQACHKVYNADVSQRVEELIERASTCAICGLRAKNYIVKAKHEVKCLEMALDSLGVKFLRFENIEDIDSDSSLVNGDSIDQSSLISASGDAAVEEMEVEEAETEELDDNICELMLELSEEELEESLRRRFGIDRDISIVLERLADDVYDFSSESENEEGEDEIENDTRKEKEEDEGEYDDYDEDCDSNDHVNKLESLKQIFDKLLRHLIPNDEVYKKIINGKPVDAALTSLLRTLGSDPLPETSHKFKYINNFRTNIQTFLQLSVEQETLAKASDSTRTVDEVLINLLNAVSVN